MCGGGGGHTEGVMTRSGHLMDCRKHTFLPAASRLVARLVVEVVVTCANG